MVFRILHLYTNHLHTGNCHNNIDTVIDLARVYLQNILKCSLCTTWLLMRVASRIFQPHYSVLPVLKELTYSECVIIMKTTALSMTHWLQLYSISTNSEAKITCSSGNSENLEGFLATIHMFLTDSILQKELRKNIRSQHKNNANQRRTSDSFNLAWRFSDIANLYLYSSEN